MAGREASGPGCDNELGDGTVSLIIHSLFLLEVPFSLVHFPLVSVSRFSYASKLLYWFIYLCSCVLGPPSLSIHLVLPIYRPIRRLCI